jgi:hypothetical protein
VRRPRFTVGSFENPLWAIAILGGVAIGMFWVHSDVTNSDHVRARSSEQVIVENPNIARGRGEELRLQLVQAAEQLKFSQARIRQLEAQLKQAPAPAELDDARNQAVELRSQLVQATERLNLSQARIDHLEAQLKQASDPSEWDKTRKQGEDLRSQLVQAKERLSSAHARIGQLAETAVGVSAESKSAQGFHAGALLQNPKAASSSVLSEESREPDAEGAPAGASSRDAVLTAFAGADKLLMHRDSGPRYIRAGPHARVFNEQTVPLDTVAEPGMPAKQPATTEIIQPAEPPERGFSPPAAVSNAANDPLPVIAPVAVATGSPGAAPTVQHTVRVPKISVALPRLADMEIASLLARGDGLLGVGDITSARLFYERASNAGDGRAALRMGATYDPGFLDRAHLPHLSGDVGQALLWYRRARDLGEGDAELWIQGLEPKSGR